MSRTSPSRERALSAAACLVGGLVVLFASGRQWIHAVVVDPGFPHIVVHVSGHTVAPAAAGLAFVGLTGAIALFVTRGLGRVATGVLITLAGIGVIVQCAVVGANVRRAVRASVQTAAGRTDAVASTVHGSAWPWVALVGGVLMLAGGVMAAVRGRSWPEMSRRYETDDVGERAAGVADPRAAVDRRPPTDPADAMWKALDRGEDPTVPEAAEPAEPSEAAEPVEPGAGADTDPAGPDRA